MLVDYNDIDVELLSPRCHSRPTRKNKIEEPQRVNRLNFFLLWLFLRFERRLIDKSGFTIFTLEVILRFTSRAVLVVTTFLWYCIDRCRGQCRFNTLFAFYFRILGISGLRLWLFNSKWKFTACDKFKLINGLFFTFFNQRIWRIHVVFTEAMKKCTKKIITSIVCFIYIVVSVKCCLELYSRSFRSNTLKM